MKVNETLLKLATRRVLMPGLKPEDYLTVAADFPIRIAKLIRDEYFHLCYLQGIKTSSSLRGS